MVKYKCKSRAKIMTRCQYACVVEVEFTPRGCLYAALWQQWEIIEPIERSQPNGKTERTESRAERGENKD